MKIPKRSDTLFAVAATSESEGTFLAERFTTGSIADAWLAAYAEELAFRYDLGYPDWIWLRDRFMELPYIHDAHSSKLKVWHT